MKLRSSLAVVAAFVLAACTHHPHVVVPRHAPVPGPSHVRLAAVMWPTRNAIITCTRRMDDDAHPVGVAGPCMRLEAGEPGPMKVVSWATLGRFDDDAPDRVPASFGGRCKLEITEGQRSPLRETTITWVTPTKRVKLDDWMPTDDAAVIEADRFTLEATFAPEGEWLAILRVGVGIGEGERVVQVASARLIPTPACE